MPKTQDGTDQDDLLLGQSGLDIINGGAGNDSIFGFERRDILNGDAGDDFISTGGGPDEAYGGPGNDTIEGFVAGGQVELIYGGADNDTLRMNVYDDNFNGLSSRGWVFGDDGNDRIVIRGDGSGHAYGGAGNDRIILSVDGTDEGFGGAGNDVLFAGPPGTVDNFGTVSLGGKFDNAGQALMSGGTGNDRLVGHAQSFDTFIFRPGDGRDRVDNLIVRDPNWAFDLDNFIPEDMIDLTAFEFEMSAQDVIDTYAKDMGDRIIFNFGGGDRLIIFDNDYSGPVINDLTLGDLVDALIL